MKNNKYTAVITGATGSLGSEIAISLAREGFDCVCQYLSNEKRMLEVKDGIEKLGVKAKAVKVDLEDDSGIGEIFSEAGGLSPLKVLINAAAVFPRRPLNETTFRTAGRIMNINFVSALMCCKYFTQAMKAEKGAVINIADVGGIRPWPGYAEYCASKSAVISMTKTLAKELAPNITVNALAPGIVVWPGKMDPAEEEKQLSMIPAARFGSARDVTSAIGFLLKNDYITGQVINIDGGRCI